MSNSTESPISITVKSTAGSLVTLRADNAEALDALINPDTLEALSSAVKELEGAVRTTSVVNVGQPMNPAIGLVGDVLGGQVIQGNFPTGNSASRMCPHGQMTRIHGLTGKFGPYKGYFCPAGQHDATKCSTQYIKANQPEWNTFVADSTKA